MIREAYILAGPTASGKTAAVAELARRMGAAVLSADSMLVYRGFDVGTAKPSAAEREGYELGGIDLVDPNEDYSTGAWLRAAASFVKALPAGRPLLVTGGTWLYFSGILRGLDRKWTFPAPSCPLLEMDRARIRERCRERIGRMFAAGWVDEVRLLVERYPVWSKTAAFAIGYAEIREALEKGTAPDSSEIRERIYIRTSRLVKHQATWFRHQTEPILVDCDGSSAEVADRVAAVWKEHGPWRIMLPDGGI